MIIGKTSYFEVGYDIIKEWSSKGGYINGFFFIGIDGELFPGKVINEVVDREIAWLKESLQNIKENKEIFNMPKEEAFKEIYRRVYPNEELYETEYDYKLDVYSINDYNCKIFIVKNKTDVRFLAAKDLVYDEEIGEYILDNIKIFETIISLEELSWILDRLPTYEELRKRHDALYESKIPTSNCLVYDGNSHLSSETD